MKRTTIRLDPHVLAEAKRLAAQTRRTLSDLIEDAVHEVLAREKGRPSAERLDLPTFGGGWVRPGVDIDNSSALLDVMENRDR